MRKQSKIPVSSIVIGILAGGFIVAVVYGLSNPQIFGGLSPLGNNPNSSIQWQSDYNTALSLANQQGKPLFIDFWASWCSSCIAMDNNVFPQQAIIEKASQFIMLRVDIDSSTLDTQFGAANGIIVYLNPGGSEVHRTAGYRAVDVLLADMNHVLVIV